MTIFRPISNYRNTVKRRRFRPFADVLHWFQLFLNKIDVTFEFRKFHQKGVNPWILTILRPISKYQNNLKRRFRPYTNVLGQSWGDIWRSKISPKSKVVNLWFLTIFPPILNFQNYPKIWKFRQNHLVSRRFQSCNLKIRRDFWGRKFHQNVKLKYDK